MGIEPRPQDWRSAFQFQLNIFALHTSGGCARRSLQLFALFALGSCGYPSAIYASLFGPLFDVKKTQKKKKGKKKANKDAKEDGKWKEIAGKLTFGAQHQLCRFSLLFLEIMYAHILPRPPHTCRKKLHRHLLFWPKLLSACSIGIYFFAIQHECLYIRNPDIHTFAKRKAAEENCIFITSLRFLSGFLSPLYTCCLFMGPLLVEYVCDFVPSSFVFRLSARTFCLFSHFFYATSKLTVPNDSIP